MITINFKRGQETIPVQVEEGRTIMEAARDYGNLPEVPGDCGGCCACATCHIKVDETWISKIGKIDESSFEGSLIEYEKGYDPNVSRLGCQIHITSALDGLEIELAPES